VLWVGRVPNKRPQQILQLKLSTAPCLRGQKRLFGSRSSSELGTVPNIVNLVALYCDNNRVIDQDK
jgi:hypothetical protein